MDFKQSPTWFCLLEQLLVLLLKLPLLSLEIVLVEELDQEIGIDPFLRQDFFAVLKGVFLRDELSPQSDQFYTNSTRSSGIYTKSGHLGSRCILLLHSRAIIFEKFVKDVPRFVLFGA